MANSEDDENMMTSPFSQPPIVSTILSYLSAKELNASAQVCRLWNDLAETEKRRRKEITWTYFPQHPVNYCCLKSSGFKLELNPSSEPSFALVLCAQRNVQSHKCRSRMSLKRKRATEAVEPKQTERMETMFQKALPRECEIGFVSADGIIGTYPDNSKTKEIRSAESLAALYFPKLPGVKIYNFSVTGIPITKNFDVKKHTGVPSDVPVKLLLVFLHEGIQLNRTIANPIMKYYIKEQEGRVAIGGAVVRHMYFPRKVVRRRNQSYGIAFTGANVEAGSIIVNFDIETSEGVKSKLKSFGESGILQGQCIAFIFTCVGRNIGVIESNIFREMYPKVPIFGVFAYGEIGIDYLPGYTEPKTEHFLHRSYSAIFVVLSIRTP